MNSLLNFFIHAIISQPFYVDHTSQRHETKFGYKEREDDVNIEDMCEYYE